MITYLNLNLYFQTVWTWIKVNDFYKKKKKLKKRNANDNLKFKNKFPLANVNVNVILKKKLKKLYIPLYTHFYLHTVLPMLFLFWALWSRSYNLSHDALINVALSSQTLEMYPYFDLTTQLSAHPQVPLHIL